MRTLFEIVEAAKIGDPTTHDECFYALLAYAGLAHFDASALRRLAFEPSRFRTPAFEAEESFRRWKMALAKSPKDWLGPNNDPANEACRERVRMARRVFERVNARVTETPDA
jgi:predicted RNA-binding protein